MHPAESPTESPLAQPGERLRRLSDVLEGDFVGAVPLRDVGCATLEGEGSALLVVVRSLLMVR